VQWSISFVTHSLFFSSVEADIQTSFFQICYQPNQNKLSIPTRSRREGPQQGISIKIRTSGTDAKIFFPLYRKVKSESKY
jgi:hypothetical protein